MRPIGLHIRVIDTMVQAADYVEQLDIPLFQCFLVNQSNRKPLQIDPTIAQHFQARIVPRKLFVHGSYWINLAQLGAMGLSILKHEIEQAKQLGAQHIILHPGAAHPKATHSEGIDTVARVLNKIMAYEKDIVIVLENTAHAHQAIGSNLADFYTLKQKLDWPENVRFCIDTAHAHAYGYDMSDSTKQQEFINLIDEMIGISMIELIHLNDAIHPHGSRIDKHALIGEGTIGAHALKSFALDPRLAHIPLILELPNLPFEQDSAMLHLVRSWHT